MEFPSIPEFGHIISYYDFHNMFDGAQGLIKYTYPYNHNERIHDSGKMFATSNETLAVELLEKYRGLDNETCADAKRHYKETFGIDMPDEMCEDLDEVYLLASADLINKFTWLSYFGSVGDGEFHFKATSLQDVYNNPGHCMVPYDDTAIWCMWSMPVNEESKFIHGEFVFEFIDTENGSIPILTTPMTAKIVDNVYYNGNMFDFSWFRPEKEHDKGILLVLNNQAIYVPEKLRDSIFVRTFIYNGQGLEHFEYVYGNNEVKLFKVNFNI